MRNWSILVFVGALALGGCGKKPEQDLGPDARTITTAEGRLSYDKDTAVFESEDGASSAVFSGSGQAPAAENLPSFVKLYPGLAIESSIQGNEPGKRGGMIIGSTTDNADKVVAFYKPFIDDQRFSTRQDNQFGGTRMLVGANGAEETSLTVSVEPLDSGARVSVIYAEKTDQ